MARQVAPFRSRCVPFVGGPEQTHLNGFDMGRLASLLFFLWLWQIVADLCNLAKLSKLSGGVDALAEKDPVQKEWQEVKNLVEAESVEAKARDKSEREQVVGGTWDKVRSRRLPGPQQPDLKRYARTSRFSLTTWPRSMCELMPSCSRSQQPLRVSSWQ